MCCGSNGIIAVQLGVVDEDVRREVLKQLFDAKEAFEKRAAEKDDKTSRVSYLRRL